MKSKIEKIKLKTLKYFQENSQIQLSPHILANQHFQTMEVEVLQLKKRVSMKCPTLVKIILNINKVMKELSKKGNKSMRTTFLKNRYKFTILKIKIYNT